MAYRGRLRLGHPDENIGARDQELDLAHDAIEGRIRRAGEAERWEVRHGEPYGVGKLDRPCQGNRARVSDVARPQHAAGDGLSASRPLLPPPVSTVEARIPSMLPAGTQDEVGT
jgi:hypothetical protein